MGKLTVKVHKKAWSFIEKTSQWYEFTMGKKAAIHFIDGIWNTIDTLSRMPTIGMLDQRRSSTTRKYYSFLAHPHYRIVYYYTATHLYVVGIRATRMGNN